MAKTNKTSTNRGFVLLGELTLILIAVITFWSVIMPIICAIALLCIRVFINYKYTCSECGGTVGKNTPKCYKCGATLKDTKINLTGRQNRYY